MRNLFRALIAALLLATLPVVSDAGVFVGVSVNIAPPELPVYVQPPPPAAGYIWIPGYWAWADEDYYWVPGTWALAPSVGLLWTPGYWGWESGVYIWNGGYWGRHVGFYGGVNYGFGYFGDGYAGGRWRGDQFYYNRSVTNVNTTNITNVYNTTVVNNTTVNRVSFNGGSGGVAARPNPAQLAAQREHHVAFTPGQRLHEQKARGDNSLRASVNGGRPPIAATQKTSGVFRTRRGRRARCERRGAACAGAGDEPQRSAVTGTAPGDDQPRRRPADGSAAAGTAPAGPAHDESTVSRAWQRCRAVPARSESGCRARWTRGWPACSARLSAAAGPRTRAAGPRAAGRRARASGATIPRAPGSSAPGK